jgi:GNAT superfamily N-acetyltransferase
MATIRVRPLRAEDDRRRFRSGYRDIDRFFGEFAGQLQYRNHIGTTYVAEEDGAIVGFVNLAPSHIEIEGAPLALKKTVVTYPVPVLRLARLAVASSARGRNIGYELLRVAFFIAHKMAERGDCAGVVVDAKPDAVDFYERCGFTRIEALEGSLGDRPQPLPMFLPMGSIPMELI